MVDPGHGGREIGAHSGDVYEKAINLMLSHALVDALQAEGVHTILTRSADEVVSLAARPQVAIDNKADFFISTHCNSNGIAGSATGIETYYHKQEPSAKALAYAVHEGVCRHTGMCDRGARSDSSLYSSGLAVLRRLENTDIPGILVECGYINNSADRAKLLDPTYRKNLAEGIVAGLKAYVEGTPVR